jgi:Arc/MetJ-type ribon-helix-helix transcriptional regulator
MGGSSTILAVRISQEYIDSMEEMSESCGYEDKSSIAREAIREFEPLLGNVPLLREGNYDAKFTFRYKQEGRVSDFIESSRNSEFATSQDAVRTAIGVFIGAQQYDFDEIKESLDEYSSNRDCM